MAAIAYLDRQSRVGGVIAILRDMHRSPAGLCDSCLHQRIVQNTRGSTFSLCERSRTDSSFPRYPRLPVASCGGHEPREGRSES
jgi:hypothetical protein